MKTIIYKLRGDSYECVAINQSGEKLGAIIFDEPFDAKLKIGKALYEVKSGVLKLDFSNLESGEYEPALIKNRHLYKMESFILTPEGVQRKTPGEEYLRALSERIEENKKRLCAIENKLAAIGEKIETKLTI